MAKPGPKKKPTTLALIQGNPGKRPLNEQEPEPPRVYRPRAPRGMTKIEQAKWGKMCELLAGMRVLTAADLDALEIYVREWCSMMEALRDINERGKLLRLPNGNTMWNPSWSAYKHSQKVVRNLQAEFGLTPSSRTGIVADAGDDGKSSWDGY